MQRLTQLKATFYSRDHVGDNTSQLNHLWIQEKSWVIWSSEHFVLSNPFMC